MGQTQWTQFLSEVLRLDARIEYEHGVPQSYSFQLSGYIDDEWVDLVRYDTAHGAPHRHISYPDGATRHAGACSGILRRVRAPALEHEG